MAEITQTRQLPAPFIEALGKTYADQLTKQVGKPIDTSKFAPQVAGQDALQTQAATLAASGVGSYQPFLTSAQQACLLYTSPSPRDGLLSRMPSSA